MRIFHLTTAEEWAAAQEAGAYTGSTRGRTLAEEGFVHCSLEHQVATTRERFYAGVPDVVLLEVDTDRLTSPWRTEQVGVTGPGSGPGSPAAFPHVYGPLDLDAVVAVRSL